MHDTEDPRFQRREWTVERVWWAVLALLVVMALLGVFSAGPLSETTTGGPDAGVEVEHERFVRDTGKSTWTIRVQPEAVQNQKATVFISDELAQAMQIQNVAPAPSTETSTRAGLMLEFDAPQADSPPVVRLRFRPDAIGVREGEVRGGDLPAAPVWMLFYP